MARQEGSINLPKFTDHLTPEDIADFIQHVKENYKKSEKLTVWYGDHIFGKAAQAIDMTSGGKPLLIATNDEGEG